jgi:1L-myo-inositol 1-phosphate cytidylyltransferase
MTAISEAVILMAGSGSRLRGSNRTFLKPFVPLLARPLICYTIDALVHAGIKKVNFVVGYESDRTIVKLKPLIPPGLEPCFIENSDWQKQNGISVLAATNHMTSPFLLTMSDHLFDESIVDLLIDSSDPDLLNVALDRKLDAIFDLDDAMKVQTRGGQIVAIGKHLRDYDAIDTGMFVCPVKIFDYLERAKSRSRGNDCSLADGVRLMAADNEVRGIDIGAAWWQDIDTPEMLACAETQLRSRLARHDIATANAGPDHGDRAENQACAGNNHPKMKDPLGQAE